MNRLYNCRANEAPIGVGEYEHLLLGGCITEKSPNGDEITIGGANAKAADFFTIYGRHSDGEIEAVTDAVSVLDALSIAAALSVTHQLECLVSLAL